MFQRVACKGLNSPSFTFSHPWYKCLQGVFVSVCLVKWQTVSPQSMAQGSEGRSFETFFLAACLRSCFLFSSRLLAERCNAPTTCHNTPHSCAGARLPGGVFGAQSGAPPHVSECREADMKFRRRRLSSGYRHAHVQTYRNNKLETRMCLRPGPPLMIR